jgi:hypothetical protein
VNHYKVEQRIPMDAQPLWYALHLCGQWDVEHKFQNDVMQGLTKATLLRVREGEGAAVPGAVTDLLQLFGL